MKIGKSTLWYQKKNIKEGNDTKMDDKTKVKMNCIMTDLSVNEIVESFKKIYNDKQLQKRIIEGGEGTVSKLNSSASYSELIESIKFKRFKLIDDIL